MPDKLEQWLRIAVLVLLALVAWQIIHAAIEANPLAKATIPPLPTLTTNTPDGAAATNAPSLKNDGGPKVVAATNRPAGTNALTVIAVTNSTGSGSNHLAAGAGTNLAIAAIASTNPPGQPETAGITNVANVANATGATNAALTNLAITGTALVSTQTLAKAGTNQSPAGTNASAMGAARAVHHSSGARHFGGGFGGFPGFPGGMMGGTPVVLPPEIQARVDKIVNSEIFAPVFHPLPLALMGIAGNTAFIRAASGQTGLVKPGDSLGDVKLLRIGTNRVLVEQNGQQQELLIFNGYGGESLLSTNNGISK